MPTLTPAQAAAIAAGVYRLQELRVSDLARRGQTLGTEGLFTVTDNSRFEAKSGASLLTKQTGFGYIAMGTGAFAGEVLIATRGTAMGLDWLSNLNIGLQSGPGGLPVHAGFNEVWKSYAAPIREFLRNKNPSRVHCVGHSLGGALANLNADMMTTAAAADVALYTFGAPRTGGSFFARSMGRRIGEIHRVTNCSDPVPMIPLFPFSHTPVDRAAMIVGAGGLLAVGHHVLPTGYAPFLGEDMSWKALVDAGSGPARNDVRSWLEVAADGKGSMMMGSASLLTMIGRALVWVLEKSAGMLANAVSLGVTISATVLDQVAYLLSTGARLSVEVAGYVKTIIGAIFRFLGRAVSAGADITMAFLRWVLDLLFTSVGNLARLALSKIR